MIYFAEISLFHCVFVCRRNELYHNNLSVALSKQSYSSFTANTIGIFFLSECHRLECWQKLITGLCRQVALRLIMPISKEAIELSTALVEICEDVIGTCQALKEMTETDDLDVTQIRQNTLSSSKSKNCTYQDYPQNSSLVNSDDDQSIDKPLEEVFASALLKEAVENPIKKGTYQYKKDPLREFSITIGLTLSQNQLVTGHDNPDTCQEAFDFNKLYDEHEEHITSMDVLAWRNVKKACLPIIQIDCESQAQVDKVVEMLANGEIYIPCMSILPESIIHSKSKDLMVGFACHRDESLFPEEWSNWCLEFVHNQLYESFCHMGAHWTRRPFNFPIARNVCYKSEEHKNICHNQVGQILASWKKRGPMCLQEQHNNPSNPNENSRVVPDNITQNHGIYLFKNGKPTHYFTPNFEPPYDDIKVRAIIQNKLNKSWDSWRCEWSSSPVPKIFGRDEIFGMFGCVNNVAPELEHPASLVVYPEIAEAQIMSTLGIEDDTINENLSLLTTQMKEAQMDSIWAESAVFGNSVDEIDLWLKALKTSLTSGLPKDAEGLSNMANSNFIISLVETGFEVKSMMSADESKWNNYDLAGFRTVLSIPEDEILEETYSSKAGDCEARKIPGHSTRDDWKKNIAVSMASNHIVSPVSTNNDEESDAIMPLQPILSSDSCWKIAKDAAASLRKQASLEEDSLYSNRKRNSPFAQQVSADPTKYSYLQKLIERMDGSMNGKKSAMDKEQIASWAKFALHSQKQINRAVS